MFEIFAGTVTTFMLRLSKIALTAAVHMPNE